MFVFPSWNVICCSASCGGECHLISLQAGTSLEISLFPGIHLIWPQPLAGLHNCYITSWEETGNLGQWGDESSREAQLGLCSWCRRPLMQTSPDADVKTQTPRGEWSASCHLQGTRYGAKCHRLWPAWPRALPWHAQMLSFSSLVTAHWPRCQEALKIFSWAIYGERRKSWRRKGERRQEETYLRNNSQCLPHARLYPRQFTLQYII